jgi:hypothetical protein
MPVLENEIRGGGIVVGWTFDDRRAVIRKLMSTSDYDTAEGHLPVSTSEKTA